VKNITVTVEEQVARWARLWAARHGSSVSKLVGVMLKKQMEHDRGYQAAMRRDLGREPLPLKTSESKYPTRDEIHDRRGLR
jgi:hypothetical protein